jgi:hypothetical protein
MNDMLNSDALLAYGLVSEPIPNGGTYTLTTRLGHFLCEAEELAGPRDPSWTILGVEFLVTNATGRCRTLGIPEIAATSQSD